MPALCQTFRFREILACAVVLVSNAAVPDFVLAEPLQKQSPARIAIPAQPEAVIDLRRMHYRNAASAPPALRVELPPVATFPGQLKLESPGVRPVGKTAVSLVPAAAVRITLPPAAPVLINPADVAGYSPAAEALRSLLGPALKFVPVVAETRRGQRKSRRTRQPKLSSAQIELKDIARFYAARQFVPVWRRAGQWSDQARSVLTRLQRAGDDALDLGIKLPALATTGSDGQAIAAAELDMSRAVVRYAQYARGGRVDPRRVSVLITAKRDIPAVLDIMRVISVAEFAGDTLRAYNPPHPGYTALRDKLADLRNRDEDKKLPPIAFGRTLRIGMRDDRVPLIRLRFGVSADDEGRETLYDTKVASAVAKFQRSRGLAANGRLSKATIRALRGNSRDRLEQEIVANMERWRWLPADLGKTHIMVNVPEYSMAMIRNGQEIHSARVIVGKNDTQTPIFSDLMSYLVVNPYWNVPVSIIKNEMLPAYQRNPDYFSRRGYEVKKVGERLVVRQPPGPRNALGYIKFLFPNRHAVYLHDTPGRHKFKYAARALSHGCVRVQDPFKLAGIILSGQRGWSERRLRRLIGGKERTIHLANKLPIHIVYFTARVDESGELAVHRDIYGHSSRLKRLLGLQG
jgi:L,D-transpeptidase YcbB